jgi:uncharacterized iron-regulated protein
MHPRHLHLGMHNKGSSGYQMIAANFSATEVRSLYRTSQENYNVYLLEQFISLSKNRMLKNNILGKA